MRWSLLLFVAAKMALAQGSSDVVISQVYGGGGNAGAPFRNDFIELFNRGKAPVSLAGWSIQYGSSGATDWQVTAISGVIRPGQYYLIQEAVGANIAATPLPDPDAPGTIAMSATAAKVALVRDATPLTGASPTGRNLVDLVGYGAANGSENAPAPALSNTTAAVRRGSGCTDTDNNSADFQTAAPAPRNSTTEPRIDCDATGPAPTPLLISEIQGSRAESPVTGRLVVTRGIVTARKTNGFFMQSASQDVDASAATSEGIFVFTQAAPPPSQPRDPSLKLRVR